MRFFATTDHNNSLYDRLQACLYQVEARLESMHLPLNVAQSFLLVVPVAGPVSVHQVYRDEKIPQVHFSETSCCSGLDYSIHIDSAEGGDRFVLNEEAMMETGMNALCYTLF